MKVYIAIRGHALLFLRVELLFFEVHIPVEGGVELWTAAGYALALGHAPPTTACPPPKKLHREIICIYERLNETMKIEINLKKKNVKIIS